MIFHVVSPIERKLNHFKTISVLLVIPGGWVVLNTISHNYLRKVECKAKIIRSILVCIPMYTYVWLFIEPDFDTLFSDPNCTKILDEFLAKSLFTTSTLIDSSARPNVHVFTLQPNPWSWNGSWKRGVNQHRQHATTNKV
jgi:hypothetical protein